ncbi:DDE-type integrase/transposase/recombinase [Sinirhodobacter sp. WL0062]|uniref:DDE-type integrase/transposase/recombinase n=1 Tax=Rhodobacter flavimaris TaxID=2907145 RepID=A0ABS8YRN6_9RHOB|nr:DDE-type integrase/transposase/recombinase [Sinirhodobacter sp. WL0062]
MRESLLTNLQNKKAALEFLKLTIQRDGCAGLLVTDTFRSYDAAMQALGIPKPQKTWRWLDNRVESSHLAFRQRERPIPRLRRTRSPQKFSAIHASVLNHFAKEDRFSSNPFSS